MSKLRRQLSAGIANNVETKSLTELKNKTCTTNSTSLPVIPTAWKKFMRTKNRSRFPARMKECRIQPYWLPRNSWKTRCISEEGKTNFSINRII
jgi:hypothetical protein